MKFEKCLAAAIRHQESGRLQQAWEAYRQALAIRPRHPDALHRFGLLAHQLGRHDLAAEMIESAIEAASPRVPASFYGNLGLVLWHLGYADDSEAAVRRALRLEPESATWHNTLGNALYRQGRLIEAADAWKRAFALDSTMGGALSNYANALQNLGRIREAMEAHQRAARTGAWAEPAWDGYLLDLGFLADPDPSFLRGEHERWAAAWLPTLDPSKRLHSHANSRDPDRPLRLGLLSADFRQHSVAYFIEPVLRCLDRDRFRVYCYANVSQPDEATARLQAYDTVWRDVSRLGDAQASGLVVQDGIDVLVELGGHTGGNRLRMLGYRPAPVQMTYLGYPYTTGLADCRYRLTDAVSDPPGLTESHYTETLLRLPVPMWCYQPAPVDVPVAPAPHEASGLITFGSFNTYNKTNARVLDAWSRILAQVPGSRLLLKTRGLGDPRVRAEVLARLGEHGVEAGRVTLLGIDFDNAVHLSRYAGVDIALDTFPYNGTTTTCEALWQGVPVVALEGDQHVARVGLALLDAIGLRDCVGRDVDAYVDLAVTLARDRSRVSELRRAMRARLAASPLFDHAGFAGHFGAALRAAWRDWCSG